MARTTLRDPLYALAGAGDLLAEQVRKLADALPRHTRQAYTTLVERGQKTLGDRRTSQAGAPRRRKAASKADVRPATKPGKTTRSS